jgi:hypothetical protein
LAQLQDPDIANRGSGWSADYRPEGETCDQQARHRNPSGKTNPKQQSILPYGRRQNWIVQVSGASAEGEARQGGVGEKGFVGYRQI